MIFIIWETFKMLHFTPGSLPSCAPLSSLQKKKKITLSSPLLRFKGSVILRSLEPLLFICSGNHPIIKSLCSDNTGLLVHSLCCITLTNIRGYYCLALKPVQFHVWYQNYHIMASQSVMLSSLFCCPCCCSLPCGCYCAKMFSKRRDQALSMDVTKDQMWG